MRISGIECEYCEQVRNMTWRELRDMDESGAMPEGWISVKHERQETRHFCGETCLILWVEKLERGAVSFREDENV